MSISPTDVDSLAQAGENARREFKLGLPTWPKVAHTLAAFANGRGGTLLVGVDDRGRVRGVSHAHEVIAELERIAAVEIAPPLSTRCTAVEMPGSRGTVVACEVGASDLRPHAANRPNGEPEVTLRLGSSTRAASPTAIRAMRAPADRTSLDDLERRVLTWLERQADPGARGAAPATIAGFANAHNIGRARARRVFWKLEHSGRVVGYGEGERRTFALP